MHIIEFDLLVCSANMLLANCPFGWFARRSLMDLVASRVRGTRQKKIDQVIQPSDNVRENPEMRPCTMRLCDLLNYWMLITLRPAAEIIAYLIWLASLRRRRIDRYSCGNSSISHQTYWIHNASQSCQRTRRISHRISCTLLSMRADLFVHAVRVCRQITFSPCSLGITRASPECVHLC